MPAGLSTIDSIHSCVRFQIAAGELPLILFYIIKEMIVKKFFCTILASAVAVGIAACGGESNASSTDNTKVQPVAETNTAPGSKSDYTFEQKVAVSFGAMAGANFKKSFDEMKDLDVNFDKALFIRSFTAAINGAEPEFSESDMQAALEEFGRKMQTRQMEKMKAEAEKNLKAGEAFLAENAKKDGVKTTESGLQYKIINPGEGESPVAKDTVKVNYRGTLIDGTEFDKSQEPIEFGLDHVIAGWTEGLQLLKKGGKAELYIPAKLAYGDHSPSPAIPANSVLVFEVELLDIKKAPAANEASAK